jgi:predicted DNA-binding protein
MQATEKFTLRISPQELNRLGTLATRLGRSKANTIRWLVELASKDLPEQKLLIVKPKMKRKNAN